MGIKSLKWVENIPPRHGGKQSKVAYIVRTLKANPNKWAEVAAFNKTPAIRTFCSTLRKYGIQVSVRKAGGGWTRVYARYNSSAVAKISRKK